MSSGHSPLDEVVRSQDLSNTLVSIKRTIRLCSTASSPQYLVLGAQTGSLYFFERQTFRFIQLCVFEDLQEPISAMCFSPDEKLLAFATAPPHRNIYITTVPIKTRRRKVRFLLVHLGTFKVEKVTSCLRTRNCCFSVPLPRILEPSLANRSHSRSFTSFFGWWSSGPRSRWRTQG